MSNSLDILNNNLFSLNNKLFISSKILDDLAGTTILHKKRLLEPLIKTLIVNTTLSLDDVLRSEPESGKLIVAYRIMQNIIVSTTKIPWNIKRQEYVAFHFTRCLIPTEDVFQSNCTIETSSKESQTQEEKQPVVDEENDGGQCLSQDKETQTEQMSQNRAQIKRRFLSSSKRSPFQTFMSQNQSSKDSKSFWDAAIRFADQSKFSVHDLIVKFVEEAESRKAKGGKFGREVNHIKVVVNALFQIEDKDRRDKLREELTLASKAQHWSFLLHLIRKRLHITGLGRNIIPSIRTLQREGSLLTQCFYDSMRPQHTYSGFRIDLVTAVKFVVFLKLKKRCLAGINVDIWGDGAEIGKVNVTRLAFRILNRETETSAQSSESVFTFACFRGKIILRNKYNNIIVTVFVT